jgi:hypothetical protein
MASLEAGPEPCSPASVAFVFLPILLRKKAVIVDFQVMTSAITWAVLPVFYPWSLHLAFIKCFCNGA